MSNGKNVILCVDDEIIVLSVLKEILLCEFGTKYIIETAESAEEGLEVVEELLTEGCEIMVVLSDWLMPGMKGDDFLIEIHKLLPKAVKIMLSGQVNDVAIQKTRDHANLHAYFSKPWNRRELMECICDGITIFENENK